MKNSYNVVVKSNFGVLKIDSAPKISGKTYGDSHVRYTNSLPGLQI
jgi:hypothetical protein